MFEDMNQGIGFLKALFGIDGAGVLDRNTIYLLYNHVCLLAICVFGSTKLPQQAGRRLCEKLETKPMTLVIIQNIFYAGVFILSVAWLVDATFNPFLYFRF